MRLSWIDNAKMVAIICVIVGHTGGLFANGLPCQMGGIIVGFNMPLFVLLSGIVALSAMYRMTSWQSLIDYSEKVLWRMVVPAVALSAIDQAARDMLFARKLWVIYFFVALLHWLIFRKSAMKEWLSKVPNIIVNSCNIAMIAFLLVSSLWLNMYWFLAMLMKLQLLSAILMLILNKMNLQQNMRLMILFFVLWIGTYFCLDSYTFEMSVYFGIGLLLKQCDAVDRMLKMRLWGTLPLFVVGCLLCRFFTINYGFYTSPLQSLIHDGLAYIYVIRVAVALLLSSAIIRWTYALSGPYNWFSQAGSRSMAFYTIHALMLGTVLKSVYFTNPHNYMWVFGFLMAFAITIVTYGIIRLCERWKVTRGVVLGDWK